MSRSSMKCNHFQISTWFEWSSRTFVVWHHNLTKLWGSLVTHCCMALDQFVSMHVRYYCHHSLLGEGKPENCSTTNMCHSSCDMDLCAPANIANPSKPNIFFVTTHGKDVIPCVLHSNTIHWLPQTTGWITWYWRPFTLIHILTVGAAHGIGNILGMGAKSFSAVTTCMASSQVCF